MIKVKDRNKCFIFIGYMLSIAYSVSLTITFYTAYFNPTKSVLVTINEFNEAIPEAIMIPITWIFIIIGLYYVNK